MTTIKLETSDAPHVRLNECLGGVTITGHGAAQVIIEIDGAESDVTTRQEGDLVTLSARRDCYITCPFNTTLTLQQVMGKLRVRSIDGPLTVESVMGDLSLRDVGAVSIRTALGDIEARHVKGALTLNQVNGDMRLRQVEGKFTLEQGNGDLNARDLSGGASVHNLRGDISLDTALTPSCEYHLNGHGDIKIRLPVSASARCILEATGNVRCDLPLTNADKTPHRITGQLGAGEALLHVRAGGDVRLRSQEFEPEFGDRLEADLEAELGGLGDIGARIEQEIQRHFERAAERSRYHAEREAERARRKADKLKDRMRREAERAAERARRQATAGAYPGGGDAFKPQAEPVSEQERLAILRMVEQKKISASDAALLLDALEGKSVP